LHAPAEVITRLAAEGRAMSNDPGDSREQGIEFGTISDDLDGL
jgi:hypothetical protein